MSSAPLRQWILAIDDVVQVHQPHRLGEDLVDGDMRALGLDEAARHLELVEVLDNVGLAEFEHHLLEDGGRGGLDKVLERLGEHALDIEIDRAALAGRVHLVEGLEQDLVQHQGELVEQPARAAHFDVDEQRLAQEVHADEILAQDALRRLAGDVEDHVLVADEGLDKFLGAEFLKGLHHVLDVGRRQRTQLLVAAFLTDVALGDLGVLGDAVRRRAVIVDQVVGQDEAALIDGAEAAGEIALDGAQHVDLEVAHHADQRRFRQLGHDGEIAVGDLVTETAALRGDADGAVGNLRHQAGCAFGFRQRAGDAEDDEVHAALGRMPPMAHVVDKGAQVFRLRRLGVSPVHGRVLIFRHPTIALRWPPTPRRGHFLPLPGLRAFRCFRS